MTTINNIPITNWSQKCSPAIQEQALRSLEEGSVLFFPQLGFSIEEVEGRLLSPTVAGKSKNVSFDISTGKLRGSNVGEAEIRLLQSMMRRFATCSNDLLLNLLPHYNAGLVQSRTSFRPVEIADRRTSWRKDDTRLHVDSFPSTPVQDRRILRVFSNVNPQERVASGGWVNHLKVSLPVINLPFPALFWVSASCSNCAGSPRADEVPMTISCCKYTTV